MADEDASRLPGAWFTTDEDELRDARRVQANEDGAEATDDPATAAKLLAEADELRTRWGQPRRRLLSLDEVAAWLDELTGELKALPACDIEGDRDADTVERLAAGVSEAGIALEDFAEALRDSSRHDHP
jgi:hypothetical protein